MSGDDENGSIPAKGLLGPDAPNREDIERTKQRIIHGDELPGSLTKPHPFTQYNPKESVARAQFQEAADTFIYQLAQYLRKELPERERNIMRTLLEATLDAWLRTKKEEGTL